eukprot:2979518-Pyramimonas_sp.AAC.1
MYRIRRPIAVPQKEYAASADQSQSLNRNMKLTDIRVHANSLGAPSTTPLSLRTLARSITRKESARQRYILTTSQSDTGCAGIFSRRTRHRMRGYILTTDPSDAGCA